MRWNSILNWRDNRELGTELNKKDSVWHVWGGLPYWGGMCCLLREECLTHIRRATIFRRHVRSPSSSYGGLPWCCYNHFDGGIILRWCMLVVAFQHHSSDPFFIYLFSSFLPLIHVLAFFFSSGSINCVFGNVVCNIFFIKMLFKLKLY